MEYAYVIETGNRFGGVLFFPTKEDAINWCHSATYWTDKEIEKNIIRICNYCRSCTSFYYMPGMAGV